MPERRLLLEIWNPANTQRLAITAHVLDGTRNQVLMGEETLVVRLSLDDPACTHLSEGSVLHLRREGSIDASYWRIVGWAKSRHNDNSLTIDIECDAIWMDFRYGYVAQEQIGGRQALREFGLIATSVTALMQDYVLPAYEGSVATFVLGVVDTSVAAARFDINFDWTTPLEALHMIARQAGCEWQFRRAAVGQYYVDLLERVGSTAGGPELRYEKNLLGLTRKLDLSEIATRLRIRSSGELQLADATWRITNVAGNVLTLGTDAASSPIYADGALVGKRFWVIGRSVGSISWLVTASDAEARTITLQQPPILTSAGVQAGDVGYFAHDATGLQRVDHLDDPAAVALYGVRPGPALDGTWVPDAINLLINSDLSTWPINMVGNGWGILNGATVTESTDPLYVRHGTSAARVQASAAGQGLRQSGIAITSDSRRPYTAVTVSLSIISGQVRVRFTNEATGVSYPQGPTMLQTNPENGEAYLTLGASGPLAEDPLPPGSYRLDIEAVGGPAEFYVDAAMVTMVVGNETPEYTREPAPQVLWQTTARELLERSTPRVEYAVDVVNLAVLT